MWASLTCCYLRILCYRPATNPILLVASPSLLRSRFRPFTLMENRQNPTAGNPNFTASRGEGGGRRELEMKDNEKRSRGRSGRFGGGSGSSGKEKIDALGRLLTRILRHMASELKLDTRSDEYVKV